MQFLKQNRQYLLEELKGGISNSFKFTIKDLYKKQAHKVASNINVLDCLDCGFFLSASKCIYCGVEDQEEKINQNLVKNWSIQRECDKEEQSVQCMILMVDLSGSMNCTYPSAYEKINKEFIVRAIGTKNFEFLKAQIGEAQVIKNFKSIQTLIESGQTVRDIAWTIKQQISREKKLNRKPQQMKKQDYSYISRKQIIEVGISHYINNIKTRRPNTIITVVYFNSNIEYPVDNFSHCKVIGNIGEKTQEEIIEEGRKAAKQISLSSIQQIGDKLISNMTKAQADGQTALTPALAFCLGMAQEWKHDLHQIVIVTDGLSNVGFGQTQQSSHLEESKLIYEQLATKYAIKSNCVVNIISFEDCSIGYDVIDEIIKRTGGVPYSIGFTQQNKQKVVTSQTISYLNFEMTTGFYESTKQFCFDNKLAIKINNPKIKFKVSQQMKNFLKMNQQNWISFDLGVKSVNEAFYIEFYVDPDFQIEKEIDPKITVAHQYRRTKKISYIIREQIIKIKPGGKEEALKSEAKILKKQIQQKLRKRLDEQTFEDYEILSKKLEKVEMVEQIDNQILQKFNKKKAVIEQYDKNIDKINRDKRKIESRRKQTYNRRKYSDQDIFS